MIWPATPLQRLWLWFRRWWRPPLRHMTPEEERLQTLLEDARIALAEERMKAAKLEEEKDASEQMVAALQRIVVLYESNVDHISTMARIQTEMYTKPRT